LPWNISRQARAQPEAPTLCAEKMVVVGEVPQVFLTCPVASQAPEKLKTVTTPLALTSTTTRCALTASDSVAAVLVNSPPRASVAPSGERRGAP